MSEAERDLRIDSLRGLALVVIVGGHLHFREIRWIFWGFFGYVSFAEIFIFLSGIVTGLVYGKLVLRDPSAVWGKALRRTGVIYLWQQVVVLTIFGLTAYAQRFDIQWAPRGAEILIESPGLALGLASVFLYQPGFSDILPIYCLFLLITPPAIFGFVRGMGAWILLASATLWLGVQFDLLTGLLDPLEARWPIRPGFQNVFAWQLVFVVGLWFGVRRARGLALRLPGPTWLPGLLLAVAVGLFLLRHRLVPDTYLTGWLRQHSGRPAFEPVRLLNFAIVAWLTAWAAMRWPRLFVWPWLAYLGQHALQVFAYHVVLVYSLAFLGQLWFPLEVVITGAAFASLAIAAWLHQRFREVRARGRGMMGERAGTRSRV